MPKNIKHIPTPSNTIGNILKNCIIKTAFDNSEIADFSNSIASKIENLNLIIKNQL